MKRAYCVLKMFFIPTHNSFFTHNSLVSKGERSGRKGVNKKRGVLVCVVLSGGSEWRAPLIRLSTSAWPCTARWQRLMLQVSSGSVFHAHTYKHVHTHSQCWWSSGTTVSDDFVSSKLTAGLCRLQKAHFKSVASVPTSWSDRK